MWRKLLYSFPIQLLINHLRSNHIILSFWIVLFLIITGNFANSIGLPYLFLDPEYLGHVNFWSFFIIGVTVGGFTTAYNITCYIIEGHFYDFLGAVSRPFTKYSLNNAIIPLLFLVFYVINIIQFQTTNEFSSALSNFWKVGGLLSGFALMLTCAFTYFAFTNKDIFQLIASNVDKRLKSVPIARGNILNKYKTQFQSKVRVDNYLDLNFCFKRIDNNPSYFRKEAILKVFGQNHLNSVIIEIIIFLLLLLLGIFRDNPYFQIPAAASGILFLTIALMLAGALTYWMKKWALTVVIVFFFFLNLLLNNGFIVSQYQAFGLDYETHKTDYSLATLSTLSSDENYASDKAGTIEILEKWKAKFPVGTKPKMVFVCASGGGQRAALWTLTTLQEADKAVNGNLMKHTQLMTGASGGLIGASYYRELKLLSETGNIDPNDSKYLDNIAKDNLNAIIFSMLVNDLFIRYQKFDYMGREYTKDRGYAFEEQINKNTEFAMNKKLSDYHEPENTSQIPMLLISPTIINDGRTLYISPQKVSYMNTALGDVKERLNQRIKGIEFCRFFQDQQSQDLRFLTALRMSATFPYISPNVDLPSNPQMEIMDAGIADNFGISDAVRFMYVFKDWLNKNTSEIVVLSIRDSPKVKNPHDQIGESLIQKITDPIFRFYANWGSLQDIRNDNQLEFAESWFGDKLKLVEFEYITGTGGAEQEDMNSARASLNWRLTKKEKKDVVANITSPNNQAAMNKLKQLLTEPIEETNITQASTDSLPSNP